MDGWREGWMDGWREGWMEGGIKYLFMVHKELGP